MLRLVTLAAAVAAISAPAFAGESVHIHTQGKSPEQVRAEVEKAAIYVCRQQARSSILEFYSQQGCITKTVRATYAQANVGTTETAAR